MARSLREKAYDRARSKALEEITTVYPQLWDFLLAKKLAEYRSYGHPVSVKYGTDNNAIYDKARSDAKTDLRTIRPGAWGLLLWAWTEHFKAELMAESSSEDLVSAS